MSDHIGVQLLEREIYLSLTNHPAWVGTMSTGSDALRLGVKADMVLFAGNTV